MSQTPKPPAIRFDSTTGKLYYDPTLSKADIKLVLEHELIHMLIQHENEHELIHMLLKHGSNQRNGGSLHTGFIGRIDNEGPFLS